MTPSFTTTVFECCSCCCCCKCLDNGIHLFIFFRPSVYPFIHFSSLLSTFPVSQRSFVGSDLTFIITFFVYRFTVVIAVMTPNISRFFEVAAADQISGISPSLRLLCNRSIEQKRKTISRRGGQQQHLKKNSRVQSLLSTSSFGQFSRQPKSSSWDSGNETATAAEEKCGNFIASTLDTLDTIYYHHQKMLTVKNAHPGPGTLLLTSNS